LKAKNRVFTKIKGLALLCLVVSILLVGCISAGNQAQSVPQPNPNPPDETVSTGGREVTDTRRVGNDTHGYISIPVNWVDFQDDNPAPGVIQFTDGDGAIITINLFEAELELEPQISLSNLADFYTSIGAEGMTGAVVTLNGASAYQIYGHFADDNIFIVVWMFEGPNGDVHFLSAEAPADTIMETVEIIETTYSFEG